MKTFIDAPHHDNEFESECSNKFQLSTLISQQIDESYTLIKPESHQFGAKKLSTFIVKLLFNPKRIQYDDPSTNRITTITLFLPNKSLP